MSIESPPSSASLVVSTELTRLYGLAQTKFLQLMEQTTTVAGENGTRVVIDNPDLKWWFHEMVKIAVNVGKLGVEHADKVADRELKKNDILLNSNDVPQELKEQLVKTMMKKRLEGEKK